MSRERTNQKFTAAIILHDDYDESLARQLAAALTASSRFAFTTRNVRWGCCPEMYVIAFTLNGAEAYGSDTGLKELVNLTTGDYKGEKGPFGHLPTPQRIDRCVQDLSEQILNSVE